MSSYRITLNYQGTGQQIPPSVKADYSRNKNMFDFTDSIKNHEANMRWYFNHESCLTHTITLWRRNGGHSWEPVRTYNRISISPGLWLNDINTRLGVYGHEATIDGEHNKIVYNGSRMSHFDKEYHYRIDHKIYGVRYVDQSPEMVESIVLQLENIKRSNIE